MEASQPEKTRSDRPKCSYKKPIGSYIPPAKRVKSEKFDVGSEDYQRSLWDESKRKINGIINRANTSNITLIVKELFQFNLIRYKGHFVSALLKAQETSPNFTEVYAAILSVVNSRIQTLGALLVNRLILQYRISFVNNNKPKCLASVKFIAHLTNQEVIHEVLGFQLIDHLIDKPTPSSLEIAIAFIKEAGAKLDQLNPTYLYEVFKNLRELYLENNFDTRINEMIDQIYIIRKDKFRDFPPINPSLDLIDENDRLTHKIELSDPKKDDYHMEFNYFKFDPNWKDTEAKYDEFKKSLLEDNDSSSSESETEGDDEIEDQGEELEDKKDLSVQKIVDNTQRDIIEFRKMVYSTIRSSVRHEEVVHKLLKARIEPELYDELCQMILDFCGQMGHYETILGLVASKLCVINRREFAPKFERLFQQFYETVHKFEQNKIRNISKFYAHLLVTESIDWLCLSCLKLRENATSSAGRCFIAFLFQELVSTLSLSTLIEYIKEPSKEAAFKDLLPRDEEQDIRFAINFFTCCGLGQITEELRQELLSR